tara:strand:- start:2753 stop:2941 length:189 start_codon:yes stop_codon:yes gene_type:complete
MADDVFSLLRKKIRTQMNDIADQLAVGTASSMEEYRRMCGMIEGLAWTEREIIDLEERMRDL